MIKCNCMYHRKCCSLYGAKGGSSMLYVCNMVILNRTIKGCTDNNSACQSAFCSMFLLVSETCTIFGWPKAI